MAISPLQIIWQAPGGLSVVLDEDGVNLRMRSASHGLEEPELDQLLAVVAEAKRVKASGTAPVPTAPDRDTMRFASDEYRAKRVSDAAARAIVAELDPRASDAPF